MKLGMIGLGRMGASMAQRLLRGGHAVVGFDPSEETRTRSAQHGVEPVASLQAMVAALPAPRTVWMMVPAGPPVDATCQALHALLAPDDILIDGGNSNYKNTLDRATMLAARGIHYLDVGTSGGVWGLEQGYSLMVGGDAATVVALRPLFETLAPAVDAGWGHVGPVGAGHFAKMVHNGIEYGLMQAYAEGFAILQRKAEFGFDLHQVAEAWRTGSVVRSWLLDLTAEALGANPTLDGIAPWVADSGEGRWTVAEAIALDVPAPVITLSLLERLRSREDDSFTDKLLAAMRAGFGGHAIKPSRHARSGRGIDQHQLGVFQGGDADAGLVADRGAVARGQAQAVDLDRAARRHQVAMTLAAECVVGALAGLEGRAEHAGVGADGQRIRVALVAAGQGDEAPGTIAPGERFRAPGRSLALAVGDDPDLEDARGAGLAVVFGVLDAGACAHHLDVAGFGAAMVAEVVLVGDRALADVGDDLHVGVRVWREAGVGLDGVVVPHPQRPPAHARRVVVAGKGEVVLRVEPAVVGAAEAGEGAVFDHGRAPGRGVTC